MSAAWSAVPLGDLVDFINGDRGKNYPSAKHRVEAGIPFINAGHLGNGTVMFDGMDYITPERFGLLRGGSLVEGDILLCIRGSLGRAARVDRNSVPGTIASSLVIMRPRPEIDSGFLLGLVQSPEFQHMIKASDNGSAQPNVGARDLANLVVDVPPLQTQLAIASVLSGYDELIENNTRRIKILEEMAQSIYKEWFVNFRYPGHENVPLVDSELGPIPEGWEVRPIHGLGDVVTGATPPSSDERMWGGAVPFITPTDLGYGRSWVSAGRYISSLAAEKFNSRLVSRGAICFTCIASIGKMCIVHETSLTNQQINSLVPARLEDSIYLFHHLLESVPRIQAMASGVATPIINKSMFSDIPTVSPPPWLRTRFSLQLAPLYRQVETLERCASVLREMRDLLLPRLVSGEIDAPVLDLTVE